MVRVLFQDMTPHPTVTWVQLSIATRREVERKHRRRRTLRLLARGSGNGTSDARPGTGSSQGATPSLTGLVPEQRRPVPPSRARS